jgi:beta-aspartyl-peptidase (threonine type)
MLVHGGAGDDFDDRLAEFHQGVTAATQAGWAVLAKGGSALDAVEAAVRTLEDDPTFDAGIGSYLNQAGEVEMDAMIMDGATLSNGAVACIQRVRNPVSVARLVMERTSHSLFVGAGAEALARSFGVPEYPAELLVAQSSTHLLRPEHRNPPPSVAFHPRQDTVGAVALDCQGNLAAATSTGGMAGKLPGRVGDSPLVGCGAYADNWLGAASCSGRGEDIMKVVLTKAACDRLEGGQHPQTVAEAMVKYLEERTGGPCGLVLLDPQGQVGSAFNTNHMVRAWIRNGEALQIFD